MLRNQQKLFNLIFLVTFLAVTILVNLGHTETSFAKDPFYPACAFQSSCLATAVIHFFQLPEFTPLEILDSLETFRYAAEVIVDFPARSPTFA